MSGRRAQHHLQPKRCLRRSRNRQVDNQSLGKNDTGFVVVQRVRVVYGLVLDQGENLSTYWGRRRVSSRSRIRSGRGGQNPLFAGVNDTFVIKRLP